MGKGIETRTINGKKVKFFKMVWSCENCGLEGVIRIPGRASGEAPFRMAREDHDHLMKGHVKGDSICPFKGTVGVPEEW